MSIIHRYGIDKSFLTVIKFNYAVRVKKGWKYSSIF